MCLILIILKIILIMSEKVWVCTKCKKITKTNPCEHCGGDCQAHEVYKSTRDGFQEPDDQRKAS